MYRSWSEKGAWFFRERVVQIGYCSFVWIVMDFRELLSLLGTTKSRKPPHHPATLDQPPIGPARQGDHSACHAGWSNHRGAAQDVKRK